ncbi:MULTISPECIES: lipid biosynthesis B12-binding/radical SAM protein [Desulfobacula]|uniref:Radical SAM domain protein n=2 Tax=Desulfobacula TaxID=28222 RepID=K0NPD7_DESTT|nr:MULTISPECIES: lipid biosynthesis B12-binding/radical SAM protein [Desulfobacula]CCK81998.1 radical SAM domain protein [Desulfobacula toluolica Tol2]SDU43550.1 lipid biosynthesis B12-binding/radical SAM protein [Desulfobacula phenolica]
MKCFLVDANIATSPYPVYPLGMSMVANALIKAGNKVFQFDFLQNNSSYEKLLFSIKKEAPEIIGISMRNIDNVNSMNEKIYIDVVKSIVSQIKSVSNAMIVLGGTAFSILPEKLLEEIGADFGIVGEGESLMVDLTSQIKAGKIPPNKILKAKSDLRGNQIQKAYYDKEILNYYLNNGSIANVQTKRGCIHKCVYCSYPYLEGNVFRHRDIKETIDDIEFLVKECKAKMIFFTDSVFNDNQGNYIELLEEMVKQKVSVPWTAYIKPEKISKSAINLMIKTGVRGVEIGSDGASDETLAGLGKSFRFKDIIECNKNFTDNKIATANFFMFGCPRETKKTVEKGISNIINLNKTVSFIFLGIRILPNTKLHDIAIKQEIIKKDNDLLEPVYYIAPGLDKDWMQTTLDENFKPYRHCVFPPDALENSVKFLHKLGHTGLMWDLLIPGKDRLRPKRRKKS